MSYFFYDDDIKSTKLNEGNCSRKIKSYGGSLMCVEVTFEKGGFGSAHTHPHEQATYCLKGVFEFTIGGEIKTIKQGDTLYIPPDIVHGCVLVSDSGQLLDIFTPIREDFL